MPRVVLPGRIAKWCWEIFKTKALSSHAICPVQFDTPAAALIFGTLPARVPMFSLNCLCCWWVSPQCRSSWTPEHQNPPNRSFTTICVHLNSPFSVSSKFVMIDLWHIFIRNNTISIYKGMHLNSLRNFRKYFDSKKKLVYFLKLMKF